MRNTVILTEQCAESYKYFGTIIDSKLNSEANCAAEVKRATSVYIVCESCPFLMLTVIELLLNQFFLLL